MYILFAILIFGFLIFIHELGHFLTAKALDVQVNEFSIRSEEHTSELQSR